ncbi:MAG: hypothetical protein KIH64_006110, partial [Mycobacterium sp.]|nr:hypothetical protein [Mycobacterium sp.]
MKAILFKAVVGMAAAVALAGCSVTTQGTPGSVVGEPTTTMAPEGTATTPPNQEGEVTGGNGGQGGAGGKGGPGGAGGKGGPGGARGEGGPGGKGGQGGPGGA